MDDPSNYHDIFGIPNNSTVEIIESAYQALTNNLGGTNSRKRFEQLTQIRDYLVLKKKEETLQKDKQISNPTEYNFLLSDENDFSLYDPSKCFQQLKIPEESSIEMLEELRERLISNSNKWREEKMDYAAKHYEKEAKLCTFLIQYKTKQMQSQNQESFEELMSEDEDPLPNDLSNDFKILNISENSSMEIIEAAYQRLIKEINFPCGKNAVSIAKSKLLTEAYENLKKYNSDNVNDRPMDAYERLYPDLSNDLNSETPMDWNSSDQDLLLSNPKTGNEDDLIKTYENVYSTVQNNDTNVKDPFIEVSSDKDPILQNPIAEDSNSKNNEIVVKESINVTNYPDEKASNKETHVKRDLFLSFEEIFRGEIKRLKLRVMDGDTKVKDEFIKVRIKPGILPETEIPFPQQANTESITPELIFVVRDKPNQKFKRLSNVDIEYTACITTKESKEGFELSVPTLENDPITMTFEDEITLDTIEEFTDRGLPFEGNKRKRGKLVVRFEINDDPNVKKTTFNDTFKDDNIIIVEKKSNSQKKENNFGNATNSRINETSASNQNLNDQKQNFNAPLSKNANSPVENKNERVQKENNKSNQSKYDSSDDFEFIEKSELDKNKSKFESKNAKNNDEEKQSHFPKPQTELPPSKHELKLTLEEIFRGCVKEHKIKIDNKTKGNFEKILNVEVKPGTLNDDKIVIPFECDNSFGTISTVAVFIVCVEPHSIFKRHGPDIEYTAKITPKEAILGGKLKVPTLDNEPCEFQFKGGISPQSYERILKRGLPVPEFKDQRGDLLVKFEIMFDQDMPQDPPVEYKLQATLEQILNGFSKKVKIMRTKFVANGNEKQEESILKVDIKPGTPTGTRITFPREGDQNPGRIPADVVFIIGDKENKIFKRNGVDIEYFVRIYQSDLNNGGSLEIPTLDKGSKYISYDGILNKRGIKKLQKCGLPHFDEPNKRGDLIVRYEVGEDPQDEPIENDINFSLEQIMNGCSKKLKIKRRIFDLNDNEISSNDEIITLELKPGTETGHRLTFHKMGDKYPGRTPSDLVFIVCDKEHPYFERVGPNVHFTALITDKEARQGFKMEVPTLQNELIEYVSTKPVYYDDLHRYPGRGLPFPDNSGRRGDLIVKFRISKLKFKDPFVEHMLPISLEKILIGCTKQMKITRKMLDLNGKEITTDKIVKVHVPKGAMHGQKLLVERQGDILPERIPGDIIFVVHEKDHSDFKRNGDNIVYTVKINESDAILGCDLLIPTLDSGKKRLVYGKAITKNAKKEFKDLGLPSFNDSSKRGKLIVKFELVKDVNTDNIQRPTTSKTSENKLQTDSQTKDKKSKEKVQTPPQILDLHLTLEDILHGYQKEVSIIRRVMGKNGATKDEAKILIIDLKPGTIEGTKLTFPKEGHQNIDTIPADIIYIVKEELHPIFKRNGNDLHYTAKITRLQAMGNCDIVIPTLDCTDLKYPLVEPIAAQSIRKIEGYGLPHFDDNEKRGELIIKFEIDDLDQQTNNFQKEPAVEFEFELSLLDVLHGCTHSRTITRRVYDQEEDNYKDEEKKFKFNVSPGTVGGTKFPFPEEGDRIPGRIPSDIIFIAKDEKHPDFVRKGANLEYLVPLTPDEARRKIQLKIPTLRGERSFKVPVPVAFSNNYRIMQGFGLPFPDNSGFGDIVIQFVTIDDDKKKSLFKTVKNFFVEILYDSSDH